MSSSAITDEVALRIGLAARVLPDMDVRLLLEILTNIIGQPLTVGKLAKIRSNRFRASAEVYLQNASEDDVKQALSFLKGRGIKFEAEPLPAVETYADGDMPGSIRVACSSESGDRINAHFGSCPQFLIYQLSANQIKLVDIRSVPTFDEDDDKNAKRAELINDCHVLCTKSIGGPAAAKVVRAGLHPMKVPEGTEAKEFLTRLQDVLQGNPPPWLAKVMGDKPEERVRFQKEAMQ